MEKERKKLNILHLLLISIGLSLVLNGLYLMVETSCVKSGKDYPIQQTLYGGDCREVQGLFWSTLYLEPAMSVDDPIPVSPPKSSFSFFRFLRMVLVVAFAFWVVLSLICRYFKVVGIVVGSLAAIILLVFTGKKLRGAWEDAPKALRSITIVTADMHPGVYSAMCYPQNALTLVSAGEDGKYGYLRQEPLQEYTPLDNIGRSQLKALLDMAERLRENSDTDRNGDFAYFVEIRYEKNERSGHFFLFGYGGFPEEWTEFVRLVNETCGTDCLREEPELVRYSPEWFAEAYGIEESDLPEGISVEQFLHSRHLDMQNLCGLNSQWDLFSLDAEKVLEAYLTSYYEEQVE